MNFCVYMKSNFFLLLIELYKWRWVRKNKKKSAKIVGQQKILVTYKKIRSLFFTFFPIRFHQKPSQRIGTIRTND